MIPSANPAARPLCAALLFGGLSSEHEVSRVSAVTFSEHMDPERYELIKIGITKEGRWLYTEATSAQAQWGMPWQANRALATALSMQTALARTPQPT